MPHRESPDTGLTEHTRSKQQGEQPEPFRSGFIALVGRPSSGKSTLLNALCAQKVAITSPKPQTTRNVIRGIVNRPHFQIVFLDTPGYTEANDALTKELREQLFSAVRDAEAVLYLMDLSRPPYSQGESSSSRVLCEEQRKVSEELGLIRLLQQVLEEAPKTQDAQEHCGSAKSAKPVLAVLNKLDALDEKALAESQECFSALLQTHFAALESIAISAKKQIGLEALLQRLAQLLPEGSPLYDSDIYTDQSPEFRICELIREQALAFCGRELPYALYVELADLEYRDACLTSQVPPQAAQVHVTETPSTEIPVTETPTAKTLWVRAFLKVERESQKGILVGKGGQRIREIRKRSTKAIRKQFGCKVELDLQVKLDYKWRRRHN